MLIFDEVMTGFRVAHGGVQSLYNITPDLTTLGKIIGGGLPVGAYGGKKEIMDRISPVGPVYQAGTLSGNPVAMTAGIATLEILKDSKIYKNLEEKSKRLATGMEKVCKDAKVPAYHTRVGSMLCTFLPINRLRIMPQPKSVMRSGMQSSFMVCWKEDFILLHPSSRQFLCLRLMVKRRLTRPSTPLKI